MKLIYCLIILLCPFANMGQTNKPLSIGDSVPDISLGTIINYPKSTAKLSDFKGKLVILDFWASWCGSCIQGFPKMDSLQHKFESNIQIILINPRKSRDDLTKINRVITRMDSLLGQSFRLPVIINDSIVSSYFKYTALPHYVWIDRNGTVKAITSRKYVTSDVIRAIINGKKIDLPVKEDINPTAY